MKLYDVVKGLLEQYPIARNSDKELIWLVWNKQGVTTMNSFGSSSVTKKAFMASAETPESITRARRKVQEDHPELQATEPVRNARKEKESMGKFKAYHDQISLFDPLTGKEVLVEKRVKKI